MPIFTHRCHRQHLKAGALAITVMSTLALAGCGSDSDDEGGGAGDTPTGGLPSGGGSGSLTSSPVPNIDLVPRQTVNTSIGSVYVYGENNLTLYVRQTDMDNQVTCDASCAVTFQPVATDVTDTGIFGQFDTLARSDGSRQWSFKGQPLYFAAGDASSGDVSAQGTDGEWFVARPDPVSSGDSSLGEVLVALGSTITVLGDAATRDARDGHTLYNFANDSDNASSCNDGCADTWPPLYADTGALAFGDYSLVTRDDNTRQWAYRSRPLYYYVGDNAPGEVNGEGLGGVWSAVRQ